MRSSLNNVNSGKSRYDLMYIFIDKVFTLDNSPVLQSQILSKMISQSKAGMKISIVTTIDDEKNFTDFVRKPLIKNNVDVYAFAHKGLGKNIWKAWRIIKHLSKTHDISHVYARGVWDVLVYRLGFFFKEGQLMYDFRGDVVAESEACGRPKWRLFLLKKLCQFAVSSASTVITVSRASKKFLENEYNCTNVYVLPSAVDFNLYEHAQEQRAKIREEQGILDSDIVCIYAGGLAHYQMIPEMLRIWKRLSERKKFRFILLTSKQPTHQGKLPVLDLIDQIPGLFHASVSRAEVRSYLAAADVGFLLRGSHQLNAVASPVKFGEYLASGLTVVSSPGLGDVSQLIVENKLGILINPKDTESAVTACLDLGDSVAADRDIYRARALKVGRSENWDIQTHKNTWEDILF